MSMAMSSPSPVSGSGSLISGTPAVVAFYEEYIENIDKYVSRAIERALPKYERALRKQARKKGWGKEAKSLAVTYDPDTMELMIQGNFDKEYGTGVESPLPVVRSAIANIDDLERMVNKQIAKDLF